MAKLKFDYFAGVQRSPEWFKLRLGIPTASRLGDWTAVSKRDGSSLKSRTDYEKELMFERTFGRAFEFFVSAPMQDGIDFEDFARRQYEQIKKVTAEPCGAWHNQFFMASPDSIVGDDGLLEIKVLRDNNFTAVLSEGVIDKHWQQIQGCLWASGRAWCDYVVINLSTHKVKIIRVLPDLEFHKKLEASVQEPLTVEPFSTDEVFDFVGALPDNFEQEAIKLENSTKIGEGWV